VQDQRILHAAKNTSRLGRSPDDRPMARDRSGWSDDRTFSGAAFTFWYWLVGVRPTWQIALLLACAALAVGIPGLVKITKAARERLQRG